MRVALRHTFYGPDGKLYRRGIHNMSDSFTLPKAAKKVEEDVKKVEEVEGMEKRRDPIPQTKKDAKA